MKNINGLLLILIVAIACCLYGTCHFWLMAKNYEADVLKNKHSYQANIEFVKNSEDKEKLRKIAKLYVNNAQSDIEKLIEYVKLVSNALLGLMLFLIVLLVLAYLAKKEIVSNQSLHSDTRRSSHR